jgi:D-serine deaminase-like pyridoxal phosphate-dependent protein
MERSGALPGETTRDLARLITKTKGVTFKGVMGYEGHLLTVWPLEEKARQSHEAMGRMIDTVRLIERDGIPSRS